MKSKSLIDVTKQMISDHVDAATDPDHPLNVNMERSLKKEQELLEKRTKEIKIRLTNDEHEKLLKNCTKASLAAWIREVCLGEKQPKRNQVREVDPQLLRQLAGIGNNLNQIARLLNQHNQNPSSVLNNVDVISALASIERELQRLHDDHKNT